jgi:hypothetical protein
MSAPAPQFPSEPHVGRVLPRVLTSSVKRSVLAMSMRFSYDARNPIAVSTRRSIYRKWTGGCTTATLISVQELRPA